MARVALTDREVARIIAAPKVVLEDVKWQPKGRDWVSCELRVENEIKVTLEIYANASLTDRRNIPFLSSSARIIG